MRVTLIAICVMCAASGCASQKAAAPHAAAEEPRSHEEAPNEGDPVLAEAYRHAYDSNDVALYTAARDKHAAWLEGQATSKIERLTRIQYGKLLFALGEYEAAAAQFTRAANETASNAPDYIARGAMRNTVLARLHFSKEGNKPAQPLRHLRDRGRPDKVMLSISVDSISLPDYSKPDAPKEAEVPPAEKALADACDAYLAVAEPEDAALPMIALLDAWVYFAHGQVREGGIRCADLVTHWPHNDVAVMCVRATTNGLLARGEWIQLEKHARAFRGNLSLIGADHELEHFLERLVEVATFNRIQMQAETKVKTKEAQQKNLIEGAEAFCAYQKEFPFSDNADKALYNAFVYYARLSKKTEAIAAGELFLGRYASSELVGQVRNGMRQLGAQ
jgi:hypothetical protein